MFARIKALYHKFMKSDRFERELKEYLGLVASRPQDMRLRVKIAELYFRSRQLDHAVATYEGVAEHYLQENFILKAVAIYKNILKLDPTKIEYNQRLADLYLKLDMKREALNELWIILQALTSRKERDEAIEVCKRMVEIEASANNVRKLAEIYQALGMTKEAMEGYQRLAKMYLNEKDYDALLRVYELILAHEPQNKSLIKDVCILYLRRKEPDNAIRTMERFEMDQEESFAELYDKAKLMKQMLRNPKTAIPPPAARA